MTKWCVVVAKDCQCSLDGNSRRIGGNEDNAVSFELVRVGSIRAGENNETSVIRISSVSDCVLERTYSLHLGSPALLIHHFYKYSSADVDVCKKKAISRPRLTTPLST